MSRQLQTPSPSPPPPIPTPTVPAQINAATRKQHILLNRLIVDRLSLALPPKCEDPRLFARGLAAFAVIFYLLEDCWQEVYDSVKADDSSLTGTHNAQVWRWLATLVPEGLPRAERLKKDLQYLSNRTGTNVEKTVFGQPWMIDDMRTEIRARPHILLAYGWVMYMAIFSGGRWIRQQLSNAGVEFWTGQSVYMEFDKHELQLLDLPGFSFLSFDGGDDGEGIKALFKARLAEAETLLTLQERQDVVDAALTLFERCIRLVTMIDREVWWQKVWKTVLAPLLCVGALALLLFLYSHDNFAYFN